MALNFPQSTERYNNKQRRIKSCAEVLIFKECECSRTKELIKAQFCKVRLCPMCQWRKSLFVYHQALTICHYLKAEDFKYIFLTLTVKNCKGEHLKNTMTEISKGFDRLLRHKDMKVIKGAFRSFDITYNPQDNTYHPHLHIILCLPKDYFKKQYISFKVFQENWKKAMNMDYQPHVYIEKIKPKINDVLTDMEQFKLTNLEAGISETSRYSVSIGDLLAEKNKKDSPEKAKKRMIFANDKLWQATVFNIMDNALDNRRLYVYTGIFRKVYQKLNMESADQSDLVNVSRETEKCNCPICNSTLTQIAYTWNKIDKNYMKKFA